MVISLIVSLHGGWITSFNCSSCLGVLEAQTEASAQRIKETREGDGQKERERLSPGQDEPQSSKKHVEKSKAEKH